MFGPCGSIHFHPTVGILGSGTCVTESNFSWVLGSALRVSRLPEMHFPHWDISPATTECERRFHLFDISPLSNTVPVTRYKPLLVDDGKNPALGRIPSNNEEFDMERMLKESSEERLGCWNQSLSGTNEQSRQNGHECEREAGQDEEKAHRSCWGGWAQRAKLLNAGYHLDYFVFVLPGRPFCLAPVTPLKS